MHGPQAPPKVPTALDVSLHRRYKAYHEDPDNDDVDERRRKDANITGVNSDKVVSAWRSWPMTDDDGQT